MHQPSKASPAAPSAGLPGASGATCGSVVLPHDVRRAVEYMRACLDQEITLADLVQVSGVAERTLRKHFRAFVGLSPLGCLRRLRLAAVRTELLAGAEGASVTTVAAHYRFEHLGRFAVEYRRRFGEPPSRTLRRARSAASARSPRVEEHTVRTHGAFETPPMAITARERPSLAILPFATASIDERFLAECLAESIAASLARLGPVVTTVAPPSWRTAPRPSRRLAQEGGERYLLAGSIARSGARLRVVVRLVDAGSARHLWGDCYDGLVADPFPLQDRVNEAVAQAIPPNIRGAEIARARHKRPEDRGAYDLAMLAIPHAFAASPAGARQALELLEQAIDIAPDYALPVGMAAWCHAQLVTYNGTCALAEEKAQALRLAARAAVLDVEDDPLVITARCAVHTMINDLETGAALADRALARDPTSAWAWERSGWVKTYCGEADDAIRDFTRAMRLSPPPAHVALTRIGIGSAHFDTGRYAEAARWKLQAIREQPGTAWVNRTLAATYARLGDRASARRSLDQLRRCRPDITIGQVVSAVPFRRDFLDRVAEDLDALGLPL